MTATRAILWNNPKIHAPERLKVWLACPEHEVTLRDFLGIRGFVKDTIDVGDLTDHHG